MPSNENNYSCSPITPTYSLLLPSTYSFIHLPFPPSTLPYICDNPFIKICSFIHLIHLLIHTSNPSAHPYIYPVIHLLRAIYSSYMYFSIHSNKHAYMHPFSHPCCLRHYLRFRGLGFDMIPAASVMCESFEKALKPHCLCSPSSDGYLVHESKVGSTCESQG